MDWTGAEGERKDLGNRAVSKMKNREAERTRGVKTERDQNEKSGRGVILFILEHACSEGTVSRGKDEGEFWRR